MQLGVVLTPVVFHHLVQSVCVCVCVCVSMCVHVRVSAFPILGAVGAKCINFQSQNKSENCA